MTFLARKAEHGSNVEVHITSGNVSVKVDEYAPHLRYFWHQLGELLNEIEKPQAE